MLVLLTYLFAILERLIGSWVVVGEELSELTQTLRPALMGFYPLWQPVSVFFLLLLLLFLKLDE